MQELEERIQSEGTVKAGNVLKVDAFLNHQCDVRLFDRMGSAWAAHFAGKHITKILTIEASGIGIACVAAQHFGNVPVDERKDTGNDCGFFHYLTAADSAELADHCYQSARPHAGCCFVSRTMFPV